MSHEPEHPTPRDAASDTPEAAAPSSSAAPADARPAPDFELPAPAPAAPTDAASGTAPGGDAEAGDAVAGGVEGKVPGTVTAAEDATPADAPVADAEPGAAPGGDAAAAPDVEGARVPGSATPAEAVTPADAPVADAEPGDGSHAVVGAADAPVAPDEPAGAPPAEVPGPRDPWAPPVPVAPGYGQPGAPAGHNPWAPPVPPVPQAPQEHVTLTKRPVPVDAPAPGPEQQPRDPWAPPAPDAAAAVPPQPPHATYPGYPGYHPGYPGYPGHPTQPEYPAYPGYPAQPGYPAHPGYPAQPGYAVGPYGGWAPPVARNGAGLTAMIMGIVGAVLAVSCFGAFLGLPLGIAAVVCGIVGLRIARRGEATNRPQALTGLILGIVSIGLSVAMIALVFSGIDDGWFDGPDDDLITSQNGDWGAPLDVDGTALYDDGVHVTLSDVHPATDLPTGLVGDGTAVTFSVELENTGDGTADLIESEISAYGEDFEEESLRDLTTGVGLPDELSPGERATREITVVVPKDDEDGTFQVEVAPGFDYDYTYWHLDVP